MVNSKEKLLAAAGYESPEDKKARLDKLEEGLKPAVDTRTQLILPARGKLISEFAEELGDVLVETKKVFFRPESREVLEIGKVQAGKEDEETLGFIELKGDRFVTVCENYINPCNEIMTRYGPQYVEKSMNATLANILLVSPQLQDKLPKIRRIFTAPVPIISEGVLTFPKCGYDSRFGSWMPMDSPEINKNMTLEEAKEIISTLYSEFCFKDPQDKINAIAALLTPFLRGLYSSFNVRTPFYLYIANRERAGKDYCAGITGIVFEGYNMEEPPISSGEKSGNNNEELRKKILSALIAGRKRLHFANNKGYINNAILEAFLTNPRFSDRALGRNEMLNFNNEMDVSGSGNVGIGFTADLANRSRFINLFLACEDANLRNFNNPNLHEWVKDNRGQILSALFALVKDWFEKDCPNGSVPFASFPEWARICGGIMENAGYGSPCKSDKEVLAVGGDSETKDMKALFEKCYTARPNQWMDKKEIYEIIKNDDDGLFGYLDFDSKSDQITLGKKLTRFVGRYLSDIIMMVQDSSIRTSRQKIMFKKEESTYENDQNTLNLAEVGRNGNVGNVCIPKAEINEIINSNRQPITNITKSANNSKFTDEEMKKAGYTDEEIKDLMEDSDETHY